MAASEEWARRAATLLWLEQCLQSPQTPHDAELILPQGGLTRGHLFELTRMAGDSSVYDTFDSVCSRDAGVALHIWLYHLQGGEASRLPLPTASQTPLNSKLRRDSKKALEEHELALKSSNKLLDNKRRRPAQGGASLESREANLATLRAAPYEQPFRWMGEQPTSAAPARTASGGGGGGGGAPPPGAAERERRLGCKLSLALGTHRRVGQDCPFRTFADEGGRDVLRFIAELGLTDDSGVWIPRPANHAQTLSYLNCRMQVELNNVRTQSEGEGPTCGEHGTLVNPLKAGSDAVDGVARGWMGKTAELVALDEHKVKALTNATGWHSSPGGALLYACSKYFALASDKGYAVGQKAAGYLEFTAEGREVFQLLGYLQDLLSLKGSRNYVRSINAPIVHRLLQQAPGSLYTFLKEEEELAAGKGAGKIRKQILAGAESPEMMACVAYESIVGDFYTFPIMHALKHRPADGSDPHVLDLAPLVQEAYAKLLEAAKEPRLVATGQAKLLPSFPYCYPQERHASTHKTKPGRRQMDMERIYTEMQSEPESLQRLIELLTAALPAIAKMLHTHTVALQKGGALTGENDTPELRSKLSGVARSNTVVECIFALEKFLSTREKGSLLRHRKGWTLFRYNNTDAWGETLPDGKLKLYLAVCRQEAAKKAKAEGGTAKQLAANYAHGAKARQELLEAKRAGIRAKEEELDRLRQPSLRCTTFSALAKLPMPALKEQLKLRALVDQRREASGKPLIRTPPKKDADRESGRAWLVLKLQALMKLEYLEGKLSSDPNDLEEGDLGCASRAPRRRKAKAAADPSDPPKKKAKGAKTKKAAPAAPEWDEDEEWPVEAVLDALVVTAEHKEHRKRWPVGTILYFVAWQGWEESYNSWEPAENVETSLIEDYEERAQEAEAEEAEVMAEAEAETEPEPEPEVPTTAAEEVVVDAADAQEKTAVKVLSHHVFGGAKRGALHNVYVRVQYSDGTKTKGGYIPSEPLAGSDALADYVLTKNGKKIAKYMPS